MSDRFVLQASKDEVEHSFKVHSKRNDFFEPAYNITPGSLIPVVYREDHARHIYQFLWGLIPEDAEEERAGNDHYEAPSEKLEEDEWLSECIQQRRCLIPADGFYKWKSTDKEKTPFYIRLLSNKLMAIGGIYGVWKSSSGRDVYSCTMLTTKANTLLQPMDERMPLIIRPRHYEQWLSNEPLTESQQHELMKPFEMTRMAVNRVSKEVNDPENNHPELIQPIPK